MKNPISLFQNSFQLKTRTNRNGLACSRPEIAHVFRLSNRSTAHNYFRSRSKVFTVVSGFGRKAKVDSVKQSEPTRTPEFHVMQTGETIYSVSRKYPELTVEKLRTINRLTNTTSLPAGTKILLKGQLAPSWMPQMPPIRSSTVGIALALFGLFLIPVFLWKWLKDRARRREEKIARNAQVLQQQHRYWSTVLASDRTGEVNFARPQDEEDEAQQEMNEEGSFQDGEGSSLLQRVRDKLQDLQTVVSMMRFWESSRTSALHDSTICPRGGHVEDIPLE